MKIILEYANINETEVIIRGDIAGAEVSSILQMLGKKNNGKLLLYKEEEQYPMDVHEIVFIETNGNKVNVYTAGDTYEAKLKLYELKDSLSAYPFVQINKSTLVNIDYVKSIQAEFSGNYCIKLKNRSDILTISRKYFKEFKERI